MNTLKVLYANNTNNLFKYTLKQLKVCVQDLSKENIIVVPDKLSLATEQEIFDALNIEVYYNISVMGISKFANKIISENNLSFLQCSALETKLLILKAIQNVSKNFKCFSQNYTMGFVDEIYAKIEQIKSSDVKIDDLIDEQAGIGTKLKFDDIKLIYNEYETLRNGRLDSGALLEVFNQVCEQSAYLKNCNVYFVGFDSLTKQGLQVLKNVAKTANFAQISVVFAKNQDNFRIYDQTFFDSVILACKQEKIECETIWCDLKFKNNNKNLILKNLFSRLNKFDFDNNYYQIIRTNSVFEEIEICVKQINYLLKTQPIKFNDIAICANENYAKLVTAELNNLGISVHTDQKTNLSELEPVKFLLAVLKFVQSKNVKYLYQIMSNSFCGLNNETCEQFLTSLTKFGSVNNVKIFDCQNNETALNFVQSLYDYQIQKSDSINNYLNVVENIIKNYQIIEKINQKCVLFEQKGEIFLNKTYLQIEQKLQSCFDSILNALNDVCLKFENFCDILEKCLTETQINSVPSGVNQVFVGDFKNFYFNKKYIFMLGMNEGVMPAVLGDTGLISDKEITSQSIKAKLEPTTKIINKRNKFKLFEILLSADDKCFMYYHTYDAENKPSAPNEFISELSYLFNNKTKTSQSLKFISTENLVNDLCFNLLDVYNANLTINDNLVQNNQSIINNALAKTNSLYCLNTKLTADVNFSKLIFKDNRASVSIVEKYNACPKSALLANGLKLQKIKKDKIEADLIGTFLHEVGEVFVRKNIDKLGILTEEEIENNVENIITAMLLQEVYYALCLPANKFLLKLLKQESVRFCAFINYEQTVSNFKPAYAEKYFGGTSSFKPINITVNGEQFNISGFVDRIDFCNDYFRIVDYKTGNTTNSKGAEHLFYGTKIQLFVYAQAIKQNLNKKLFGVFYLPIKNGFSKQGKACYAFSGFFENNASLAINCDKLLTSNLKSDILNVGLAKIKSDGEIKLKKKANLLTTEQLDSYLKYAVQIVKQTIKDVKSGYFECSPVKARCRICEFNQICQYAFDEKRERTENYNVDSDNFAKVLENTKDEQ